MSRYKLSEIATLPVAGKFQTGNTVTISLIDLMTSVTEPIDSAVCTEIGSTGFFKWNFSNLTTQPTVFKRFLWTMTNGSTSQSEIVDCGGWVEEIAIINNLVESPTISLENREDIIVGDSWSPRFEIKSTDSSMKVKVEITDGGGNILKKATSNVTGGADSQVKIISAGDTFMIYRLYLTAIETANFSGNKVHINITAILSDLSTITEAYSIPISSESAITWNDTF